MVQSDPTTAHVMLVGGCDRSVTNAHGKRSSIRSAVTSEMICEATIGSLLSDDLELAFDTFLCSCLAVLLVCCC